MSEGVVVWLTGADAQAVERVADAVGDALERRHVAIERLTSRTPGIEALAGPGMERRVAFVAGMLVRHGVTVLVAVASPSRAVRDEIRAALGRLIEVHVVPGDAADYEPPLRAEVEVEAPAGSPGPAVTRTLRTLEVLGYLRPGDDPAYSAEEERAVIRRLKSFGYI
jgi:hypothetical protein